MQKDTLCKYNSNLKKAGILMLILDKINFKSKLTKDKEEYIGLKWLIHQELVTIVKIYTPNTRVPKYTNVDTIERRKTALQ